MRKVGTYTKKGIVMKRTSITLCMVTAFSMCGIEHPAGGTATQRAPLEQQTSRAIVSQQEQQTKKVEPSNEPNQKGYSMEPRIGISKANLEKIGTAINTILSDNFALYVKTLNYHWNLKSKHFHDLHAFFKELYESQFDIIDDLAERAQTMGSVAYGAMADFLKNTQLKEASGKKLTDQQMLKDLLADYETIIKSTRDAANKMLVHDDIGTNNFLIDILERQEKKAWMIRSSIE